MKFPCLISAFCMIGMLCPVPVVASETLMPIPPAKAGHQSASCRPVHDPDGGADELNNTARFLAGMPVAASSPLHVPSRAASWQNYAADSDRKWVSFFKTRGRAMTQWREQELSRCCDNSTVFYPFSGPDFLYAHTLFPRAGYYLLIGLEPVGSLPDPVHFTDGQITACTRQLGAALEDILQISFFKTNDMASELGTGCVSGTLPLLMILLARTQHHITTITFFDLSDNGTVRHRPAIREGAGTQGKCRGVSIDFTGPAGSPQTLVYVSADLSDRGLSRCTGCAAFCESLRPPVATFVKSASYLMHKGYFSRMRNLVLQKSAVVVQDDSAIPFSYYSKTRWDVRLYGSYTGPIGMFKKHFEKDLDAAYKQGSSPLPFRFGYAQRSNLLIAVKKMENPAP